MPELPEVETVVRELNAFKIAGRRVCGVVVRWPPMVAPLSTATFIRKLRGLRIVTVHRRAKYIVMKLSDGWTLLGHLRMTGQLCLSRAAAPREKHQHVIIALDNGMELRCRDTRKFGRWILTRSPEQILDVLGPEPLAPEFTPAVLRAGLQRSSRALKPLLLDQKFLAGLGNIYVDEALWASQLHPLRRTDTLNVNEIRRLHKAVRQVLRQGIRHGGTTLGKGLGNFNRMNGRRGDNFEWLKVFRRTSRPCRRCGTPVQRLIVAQRATHICPVCQPSKPQFLCENE